MSEEEPSQRAYFDPLHTEYSSTIDRQIERIHYTDRKALSIVKLNLLILGLIVALISVDEPFVIIEQISPEMVDILIIAAVFHVISIIIAVLGYGTSSPILGVASMGSDEFDDFHAIGDATSEHPFLLALAYIQAHNRKEIDSNKNAIKWAQGALLMGILVISMGVAWTS